MLRRNAVRSSFWIAHTAYWQVNDEMTSRIVAGRMTFSAPDSVWNWNGFRSSANCDGGHTCSTTPVALLSSVYPARMLK